MVNNKQQSIWPRTNLKSFKHTEVFCIYVAMWQHHNNFINSKCAEARNSFHFKNSIESEDYYDYFVKNQIKHWNKIIIGNGQDSNAQYAREIAKEERKFATIRSSAISVFVQKDWTIFGLTQIYS